MSNHLSRRAFTGLVLSLPFATSFVSRAFADPKSAEVQLAELEKKSGGRLGVAAHDLGSGARIARRGDERFALCSTFKCLAAGFVLERVDRGEEQLERRLKIAKSDLLPHSPVTEKHVGSTMSLAELCEAAVTLSDNGAANLILASFGGPAGLTEFLRSTGDEVTRLDRTEPGLNEAKAGDPRDTTSPNAMNGSLNRLVLGEVLSPASRQHLKDWLLANKTGDARIRAGVPKGWVVGDKTGTGRNGATNDAGILWPPERRPVLLSIYFAESKIAPAARAAVIADAARIVSGAL
jgi:beta-lactamase class A